MKTLYGLKNNAKIKINYNPETKKVEGFEGIDEENPEFYICEDKAFSLPYFIEHNNIPFYPSKYEFINDGIVVYSSLVSPLPRITFSNTDLFSEQAITQNRTIKLDDLSQYDKKRIRYPSQNNVMGESAQKHIQQSIDSGEVIIENLVPVCWHWCHLVAFSMLPTSKAQIKRNLVCGTAACNGHMANIEAAVKKFIYTYKRPLSLEVTATVLQNTHIARRIRYRIYDGKGSKMCHSEYYDALTDIKTDASEQDNIYNRLINSFGLKNN